MLHLWSSKSFCDVNMSQCLPVNSERVVLDGWIASRSGGGHYLNTIVPDTWMKWSKGASGTIKPIELVIETIKDVNCSLVLLFSR